MRYSNYTSKLRIEIIYWSFQAPGKKSNYFRDIKVTEANIPRAFSLYEMNDKYQHNIVWKMSYDRRSIWKTDYLWVLSEEGRKMWLGLN